jgi:hypothetical protein
MISKELLDGLGLAFNEATLLGAEVDTDRRLAAVTLDILMLPDSGPAPADSRIQVMLHGVSRVAASLRNGLWNDATASAVPFALGDLLSVVQSFGGCAVYGDDFFDVHEAELEKWHNRFSLDVRLASEEAEHSLSLFQEGGRDRHLDLCIWFQDLTLHDASGGLAPVAEIIESAHRWWKAFRENDPRTTDRGLIPLKS